MKPSPFLRSALLSLAIMLFLATPVICVGADPTSGPSANIVISQVYGGGGNSGATYKNDFIELFNIGTSAVDVTGWSVQYASSSGTSWQVTPLTGSIEPGRYYLIQEAKGTGGTIELPTPQATGTIAMSATAGKIALVMSATALTGSCTSSASIVDFVGFGTANCFEGTAGTPAISNTTAALRKGNGCTDTNANNLDFKVGPPNPRNSGTASYDCSTYVPPAEIAIHTLQGSGAKSPYVDKEIVTSGIVTARKYNGFFIQEADQGDDDPETSDGVFVFTGGQPPAAAAVGNLVSVGGTVQEYAPSGDLYSPTMTEIIGPSVTVISTGNAIPAAIVLNPEAAGASDQLERYEGMRVSVPAMTVVGPTEGTVNEKTAVGTSNGIFYGVVEGAARPFREAGISVFEPLPLAAPCCIPRFDENPERIRVDSDALLGQLKLEVTPGAKLTGVIGPLDFGDRTYTIDPEVAPVVVSEGILSARAVPLPNGDEFTVAAYNMERFFDSSDLSGVTQAALDNRISKASLAIINVLHLPDILAVEEMGNINSLQKIADKVNTDAGAVSPAYVPYLFEGNDPGGIDVGFLVKSSRVNVISASQEGKTTPFIWGTNEELLNDRPPVVLKAVVGTSPMSMPVTVIVNHLRSLNGIEEADGRVRAKRAQQAEFLANLIQGLQTANPLENIVSVGDYNAFDVSDGYVDVMGTIRGVPASGDQVLLATSDLVSPDLTDLVTTLPKEEQYSYSYGGNAQVLDHALINQSIATSLTQFAYARNNADFPESFRTDATRPERLSDHDIPVAYFTLLDKTAPTVACGEPDGEWHADNVAISCTAADGGSGLANEANAAFDLVTSVAAGSETANANTDSRNVCDKQDQCTAAGPIGGNKVDRKYPEVSVTGVSNGALYPLGSVPTAACSTADMGSGVAAEATLSVTGGTGNGVGLFTATCSGAKDVVGNATPDVSVSYTVAYGFRGFFPPLANRSSFKAGSTIPAKWQLLSANGSLITTLSSVTAIQVAECATNGQAIDAADAGNSGLRFGDSQYMFNWQTTGLPAGCYNLMLKLDDTTTHSVMVMLK